MLSSGIKDNNIFLLDKNKYQQLVNSKNVYVNVNMVDTVIPLKLLQEMLVNEEFYSYLTKCIKGKTNLEFALTSNDEIISKITFPIVAIIIGLKQLLENDIEIDDSIVTKINYLCRQIDFASFLKKSINLEFETKIDNHAIKLKYSEILSVMLEPEKYLEFINSPKKVYNLSKEEFAFCLKEFFTKENILNCYLFNNSFVQCYQYIISNYDIEAINNYLVSDNLWSNINLNETLINEVSKNIPPHASKLEQVIYIYYILTQILNYDEEFDEVDGFAKKHKDFSRIELITSKNNRVANYEFTAIFAKFLEKLNINYKYSESNVKFRYKKYLLKATTISSEVSRNKSLIDKMLKGITVLNQNKNTKAEFEQLISKIYQELYAKKMNLSILKMSFTDSLTYYQKLSNKNSVPFKEKLELFYALIGDSKKIGGLDIGYIFQLKEILFNESELNSNIRFITISENDKNTSNPVVIITVNTVNINLYNTNNYIYYNPPYPIENYSLADLRKEFFNGRFSYIKGTKEDIIGLEKSSV